MRKRDNMRGLILAAGQGTRLQPLTNNLPKCLVEIAGKPILEYQLESLDKVGIHECAVVIGFLGDKVKHLFGPRFGNLSLSYISNIHFKETNNIYSLWLASQYMVDDIILLEGDILFESPILEDLISNHSSNAAVVDIFQSHMDGTAVLSENGFVSSMVLKSNQPTNFDYQNALKTVNIYKFSKETMRTQLIPTLDEWIVQGFTDQFYEATIAQLIEEGSIQLAIQSSGNRIWVEIDTVADIDRAHTAIGLIS